MWANKSDEKVKLYGNYRVIHHDMSQIRFHLILVCLADPAACEPVNGKFLDLYRHAEGCMAILLSGGAFET